MSKRKDGPSMGWCEVVGVTTRNQKKRTTSKSKQFNVTCEQDSMQVLHEIKPLLVSARTLVVNGWKTTKMIQLSWTNSDDFQLDDESEQQCWIPFKLPCMKLFRVLFTTATNISRLEIINCALDGQESFLPPLCDILSCIATLGHWQQGMHHLKVSNFSLTAGSFEKLSSYPLKLTSLELMDCWWDGSDIERNFLSKLTELESLKIWNSRHSHNCQLLSLMNGSIRNMSKLKILVLSGEADPHDEEGMEAFVNNVAGLKFLYELCVSRYISGRNAHISGEAVESLQDKLIKNLPLTNISLFNCQTIVKLSRGHQQTLPYGTEALETLARYLSKNSECKLSWMSQNFLTSSIRWVYFDDTRVETLALPTEFEQRIFDAVAKGLGIPNLDVMNLFKGRSIVGRRMGHEHLHSAKCNLITTKLGSLLNDFYLPIIQALNAKDNHVPLGLWPYILAKKNRWLKQQPNQQCGPFRIQPTRLRASFLFTLLKMKPAILTAGASNDGDNCQEP